MSEYFDRYQSLSMRRDRGILEVRFHTNGDSMIWDHGRPSPHSELPSAFADIANDPENLIVIMTGTGKTFIGPAGSPASFPEASAREWDAIQRTAYRLTRNLLDIDALVIACVNGPALRHAEIPLLADIVLAAPEASFQDSAHFVNRTVPGDGVSIITLLLLGYNRGRYFLLTGQTLTAAEALSLGLVNEVVPRADLLPRAWELAVRLVEQNPLVIRGTRRLFTQPLKAAVESLLPYSLAAEGLAAADETERRGTRHTL